MMAAATALDVLGPKSWPSMEVVEYVKSRVYSGKEETSFMRRVRGG